MYKIVFVLVLYVISCWNVQAQQNVSKWVNFQRYEELNRELKKKNNSKRVIFLGNSITEGWVNNHPEFFDDNGYIGRGISGQTSYQFLLRFRQDVINLSPDIVVINAATNDIAENSGEYNEDYTFGNIVSMVELAYMNNIKVILTSTLPAVSFSWNPKVKDASEKIIRLNTRISKYARKYGIPFVDYYSSMVCKEDNSLRNEFTSDGVHPTLKGYKIMEQLIYPVIIETLKYRK